MIWSLLFDCKQLSDFKGDWLLSSRLNNGTSIAHCRVPDLIGRRGERSSRVPGFDPGGHDMRYLKYAVLLGICMVVAGTAHAQVRVGVGIGYGPGYVAPAYVAPAPVCAYGYYGYAPYACAPYGYYGPDWFAGGVFVGAGPWFHGPGWLGRWGYANGWYGRPWYGHPGWGRAWYGGHGFVARGPVHGPVRSFHGAAAGRGGFHGAAAFHGSGFHGGGSFHGGGRR